MKKIFLFTLMVILIMALCGCSREVPNNAVIEKTDHGGRIIVETILHENILTEDAG